MTGERERTLEELRLYGRPGRRAELLEAAFNAGNTNIAMLTRIAGISRAQTYKDLHSRGIDPQSDRPQETIMALTIAGFTGTDAEQSALYCQSLGAKQNPLSYDEFRDKADAWEVARFHNEVLVPAVEDERSAYRDVLAARQRLDTTYEALSTAQHWPAAHHAFIRACRELREVVTTWRRHADRLSGLQLPWKYYELVDDEQTLSTQPSESLLRFPSEIIRLIAERRAVAAETAQYVASATE